MTQTSGRFILAIVACSVITSSVSAQSLHPLHEYGTRDMRGSVNLTIPFGGRSDRPESKRQISLGIQQQRIKQDPNDFSINRLNVKKTAYNLQPHQARVAFKLDDNPQFMMNGTAYRLPEEKTGASTLGKVGIGIGVVAGVLTIIAAIGVVAIVTDDGEGEE